jgi:hypothetical protein
MFFLQGFFLQCFYDVVSSVVSSVVVAHGLETPYVIPSHVTPQLLAQLYLEQSPSVPVNGSWSKFMVPFSPDFGRLHLPKL